jgi:hypothetical protein
MLVGGDSVTTHLTIHRQGVETATLPVTRSARDLRPRPTSGVGRQGGGSAVSHLDGRTIAAAMRRSLVERSLRDVHGRLVRARDQLAVLDEQLAVLRDAADDARIRALVSETPLAGHEYAGAQRHADVADRARAALTDSIGELERRQDELLDQLVVEPR